MSSVKIQSNVNGTGSLTIAAPNTNTDRTLTLPDESGTLLTSASAVAASQIATALNASGSAPIYACRAWVNFNGTGTVAIRASGNVSSITDNGTGDYTVNFTTAMPDANYCIQVATGRDNSVNEAITNYRPDGVAAGSIRVMSQNRSAVMVDPLSFSVAIFR